MEISFGKYQQSLYMKIGDQEFILLGKEILEVLGNKYIPGQVKFILKLNDGNFILGSFLWDLDLVSVSSVSLDLR